jgi:hypothetical protein
MPKKSRLQPYQNFSGFGMEENPGPAAYTVKSTIGHANGVTLKSRHYQKPKGNDSPGPSAYEAMPASVNKLRSPSYSLTGKPKAVNGGNSCDDSPGPAAYDFKSTVGQGYAKSLSSRQDLSKLTDHSPGPAAYSVSRTLGAGKPKWSFGGRQAVSVSSDMSPAPGAYDSVSTNLTRRQRPSHSLAGRTKMKRRCDGPGPAAYDVPSSMGKGGGAFSMGARFYVRSNQTRPMARGKK